MRIDLKVPFAEKDTAKALGARWDAAKKIWYIQDVADVTPFMHWIPIMEVSTEGLARGTILQPSSTGKGAAEQSDGIITGPAVVLPHCGCSVLPWEDCEHTVNP